MAAGREQGQQHITRHWQCCPYVQIRGKRTKTVVDLNDLPQGIIRPPAEQKKTKKRQPKIQEEEATARAYPPVLQQVRRHMNKFENCVVLTRVGGFYELYFEHADECGPLLNLKVVQRKTAAGMVSMAGFPFFQLDRFLKILVQDLNRYVAIAEEYPNDVPDQAKMGGMMHDRKISRIITPGTLIDEQFMDPYASNYVMAIHVPLPLSGQSQSDRETAATPPAKAISTPCSFGLSSGVASSNSTDGAAGVDSPLPVGLAWLDLSTGHFFTHATDLASLGSMLSRVAPKEVLLDENLKAQSLDNATTQAILSILAEEQHVITYAPLGQGLALLSDWTPMLESAIATDTAATFSDLEVQAGRLLLHYVKDRLQGLEHVKLQPPVRHETQRVMAIDKNGMRSLEIRRTIRDGALEGSLLHAIRRTVTRSGTRLLNEWLSAPSASLEVIHFRQDLVACFLADETLRENITLLLRRSYDSQRLVQKFALGRGNADDLLDLASTIKATEDIVGLLVSAVHLHDAPSSSTATATTEAATEKACLQRIMDRFSLDDSLKLAKRIRSAIDEEGLVQQHQLEEDEAGTMIALAQKVVNTEGALDESLSSPDLPKSVTSSLTKSAAAAAATTTTTKKRNKATSSIREFYGEDNEVWIMKPNASRRLKQLHQDLHGLSADRETLTTDLRTRLNAPSLTLKRSPGMGYIAHIKGRKDLRNATLPSDQEMTTGRTTASSRSFHVPEWTDLGCRLDHARVLIRAEESRVFAELRKQVVLNIVKLRRNARVLDELDIATSFARLAIEGNLVRPVVNNGTAHVIVGGRHPTVEGGLRTAGRTFTSNDCFVSAGRSTSSSTVAEVGGTEDTTTSSTSSQQRGCIWLITGPNMAGKSTFLRQNALLTVLAQIGSYVPASYAEIGIVDALFSRVGSADNLYRDQSTFMVEMLETATILRHATPRSFVIMDEIGRGTTPEDGCAVAFACLHHLVTVNRCRTLFATHFHGVADLVARYNMRIEDGGAQGMVEMYCTDVEEDEMGGFSYVHRLRRGINRQSHALKVARLAGLPEAALSAAREVLVPQQKLNNVS
ncbi:muts domain V [Coniella lustricola]|uniref:Muts domain V n=1 Tax=Coniella lustricola TaxID=2025994 RepID=A0A2T3A3J4_9PEZI|nr:muts domain V [Coniella lustricola]